MLHVNSVLSALKHAGHWQHALGCFHRLPGVLRTFFGGRMDVGFWIIGQICRNGIPRAGPYVVRYLNVGCIYFCKALYPPPNWPMDDQTTSQALIEHIFLRSELELHPDEVSFNTIISAQHGKISELKVTFSIS